MNDDGKRAAPFSFVGPDHPFRSHIDRFLDLLDSRRFDVESRRNATDHTEVRSLMRSRRSSDGQWRLKWLYVSLQLWHESKPRRFHAVTFRYLPVRGEIETWEFPHDPRLETAA